MPEVELKSPNDGSVLSFRVVERRDGEVEFETSISTPWYTGRAPASTYMNVSPSALFRSMAEDWRGWQGQKSWKDLDGRVLLAAESDTMGHVRVIVELIGQDYESRLLAVVRYDAGQLENMAIAVGEVLG